MKRLPAKRLVLQRTDLKVLTDVTGGGPTKRCGDDGGGGGGGGWICCTKDYSGCNNQVIPTRCC